MFLISYYWDDGNVKCVVSRKTAKTFYPNTTMYVDLYRAEAGAVNAMLAAYGEIYGVDLDKYRGASEPHKNIGVWDIGADGNPHEVKRIRRR